MPDMTDTPAPAMQEAEFHLNELMRLTQPWPNATIPCATVRSHVEQALSKLRAHVAEPETMEEILRRERERAPWALPKDLTMPASAPVAGEAKTSAAAFARAVLARYGHTPLPIGDAAPQASAGRLASTVERLATQLRECAETLGADQIDEHRAMRAYADSMDLLAKTRLAQRGAAC